MRYTDGRLILSATDLSAHQECGHKTSLDLRAAQGVVPRPGRSDIERRMLEERGRAHEAAILQQFRASGLEVLDVSAGTVVGETQALADKTRAAMARGVPVIYQGLLLTKQPDGQGDWVGRPDFLRRVCADTPHYEPIDAKLASAEQARAILQLCVYADQLEQLQGIRPARIGLALGGAAPEIVHLRTEPFFAYYLAARERLVAFTRGGGEPYPEPVAFCDVCEWWQRCEERRRSDDHLSLVAGITRRQRTRLVEAGITTLATLGGSATQRAVQGMEAEVMQKIQDQARLQLAARLSQSVHYELVQGGDPNTGLEQLPEPTPGDLFLDLEGDAFALAGGIEYLFGLVELGQPEFDWTPRERPGPPRYHAFWASNPAEEKQAFEALMKRISTGLSEFPNLHVFHFGQREKTAIQTLSCRHATCEKQVDDLLRRGVLVDLHTVVRQGLRASVEAYTLKALEVLHGFQRTVPLRDAARAMQRFGWWLSSRNPALDVESARAVLAGYNEEDCRSTWHLREWLEQRREELARARGRAVPRPSPPDDKEVAERQDENSRTARQIQADLPADPATDTPEQGALRLLADLLGWHWRELKSSYWEYYSARDVPESEWIEDRLVLGGLHYEGVVSKVKQSTIHRYSFPPQEHSLRRVPTPVVAGGEAGTANVVEIGRDYVLIRRGNRSEGRHPRGLRPGKPLPNNHQEQQLNAVAQSILRDGLTSRGEFSAARELLLRLPPRVGQNAGAALVAPGEDPVAAVRRLCLKLDGSVLSIQGPPGSGKTYCAKEAILALVQAGKRVGVTANSHEVILGVLSKVSESAAARGLAPRIIHHDDPDDYTERGLAFEVTKSGVAERLKSGQVDLLGATSFVWTRPEFQASVDVLFVDEAGQMSLANALAASTAARSLVLLGDPAQLDQPQKGVHPAGADVSALGHVLGADHRTMPEHIGVFLAVTRRLPPAICDFTSRLFYEGKLHPLPGLEAQRIHSEAKGRKPMALDGAGLRFVPVQHAGNTSRSDEEVAVVAKLVEQLLDGSTRVTLLDAATAAPKTRKLEPADVLVIAPYNAQVGALRERLPKAVPVGTVDKFQGKEAPVVIFSMTTSSADEAPRGLEFLFSLNRLNVATSRAQALVVLVANPELARANCRTPRQLELVNALCAYLLDATTSSVEA